MVNMEEYTPLQVCSKGTIIIPREEYNSLVRARMGLETIGASETKYGFNSDVIHAVLKLFGYEHKEDDEDA